MNYYNKREVCTTIKSYYLLVPRYKWLLFTTALLPCFSYFSENYTEMGYELITFLFRPDVITVVRETLNEEWWPDPLGTAVIRHFFSFFGIPTQFLSMQSQSQCTLTIQKYNLKSSERK